MDISETFIDLHYSGAIWPAVILNEINFPTAGIAVALVLLGYGINGAKNRLKGRSVAVEPSDFHAGPNDPVTDKPAIPLHILKCQRRWMSMGEGVQSAMIGLGMLSVIASLGVSTFEPELGSTGTRVVAFIAALATGILSAFSMMQKNRDVWAAWRRLTAAILRYETQQDFTLAQLIDVYEQAEQSLGNVVVLPPQSMQTSSDQTSVARASVGVAEKANATLEKVEATALQAHIAQDATSELRNAVQTPTVNRLIENVAATSESAAEAATSAHQTADAANNLLRTKGPDALSTSSTGAKAQQT